MCHTSNDPMWSSTTHIHITINNHVSQTVSVKVEYFVVPERPPNSTDGEHVGMIKLAGVDYTHFV